jgi:hypothetical protein
VGLCVVRGGDVGAVGGRAVGLGVIVGRVVGVVGAGTVGCWAAHCGNEVLAHDATNSVKIDWRSLPFG